MDPRLSSYGERRRRPALWLAAGLLPVLLALVWFWSYAAGSGPAAAETLVYIPPGSSFAAVERTLVEAEVLREDRRFRWLAYLSGQRGRLRAGEYAVAAGASPREILQLLTTGRTVRRQVTIPEGSNLFQVARLLAGQQLLDAEDFVAYVTDPVTVKRFGLDSPSPAPSLEGWLFPDTYFFTRGQSKEEITAVMVRRARTVLDELLAGRDDSGLSRLEIMTLASIVEKETGLAEERSLIAGVFFNRLEKGMRLQTDPTVIYGLQSFDRRLSRQDLRTPTPYNTYTIHGLPPGPIANPGRAAIAAVLEPEETDYLYFVSRNDGSHQFSTNLRDHNRAVNRYQR
ncbi:endolytic transglycosylase MltG [Desulfurivibrio alkaliphilus]|uniref:Endolytic murein transglycosylase n=1 Tax=Desulfurivibrio alkaliphilus (strain DSM 19089 / UNIQEM U267 / AHT2) TaxID=589865 RepID=D6Z6E7_DESAT|nr:endolytic transglycosylase MltG [Desulfurivibrio alkaliphilus]ADH86912.1 aminodeoxychorismate lyase [Desulfurivibrio alkaliphilus AHT 2]